jgi:tRNA A-37 threonylcarbamoyl transferase component Bud32
MSELLAPPALLVRQRSTMEPLLLEPALLLGAGGEARVLAHPHDGDLVAKLYHEPTLAKARKVELMMADEPALDASAATLAWPRDLLLEMGGGFAGFLMERAEGPRVFELYNPSTRRHAAPKSSYALLHRVGANVAAAFEALHARGYVVGDVNESNVLVDDFGSVTLVDTDSMQVPDPANGTVHRSRVGKAEFTPPELQGRSFADFDRSPEHDRFGLAVLLFLLLMEGTHPFAGRMADGSEAPPVEERIRRGLFPHGTHREIHPPMLAPEITLLHPALRSLFVRAFVDGHRDPAARPTAAEWRAVLAGAEAKLRKCAKNRYHRFGAHLDRCPWCERAALLGGRDPFPAKAPPPLERKPRGSNRGKGSAVLRSAPARPSVAAPAKKSAPARKAAPAPKLKAAAPAPAPAVPAGPSWLQGVRVPPWLDPLIGPSGAQHPAAWVAPCLALLVVAPQWLQFLAVMGLIATLCRVAEHPRVRVTADTLGASAMLLMAFLLVSAVARIPGTPEPFAPVFGAFRDDPGEPAELPPGVEVRLGSASTPDRMAPPPELLNRQEAQKALAEHFFRAGMPETRGAAIAVLVEADGSVGSGWMKTRDPALFEFLWEARQGLTAMRFTPPTIGGTPVSAVVWIEVDFLR